MLQNPWHFRINWLLWQNVAVPIYPLCRPIFFWDKTLSPPCFFFFGCMRWGWGWGHSYWQKKKQIYVKDSGYGVNGNPDISEHSVNTFILEAKTTPSKNGKLCLKYFHIFDAVLRSCKNKNPTTNTLIAFRLSFSFMFAFIFLFIIHFHSLHFNSHEKLYQIIKKHKKLD